MERYMVGDEFGHMYYEDSEEFYNEKELFMTQKI
jgi:hypothetical protein